MLGLRTAGSYFAPVVTACLRADGYEDVDAVTIHPKKGVTPAEAARLARCARRGGLVVMVDEPLDTGATLARAIGMLRRAGIAASNAVALLPVHATRRDWTAEFERLAISDVRVLRLEPEEWHKRRLLAPHRRLRLAPLGPSRVFGTSNRAQDLSRRCPVVELGRPGRGWHSMPAHPHAVRRPAGVPIR